MKKLLFLLLFFISSAIAASNVVNVYVWATEIPVSVFTEFSKETGINVNISYYDSNETLYSKLKANPYSGYDVIVPSSYYVDRMRQQGMLLPLNKNEIANFKNLDPEFLNKAYDPQNQYDIPYAWGGTGIFVNKKFFTPQRITTWKTLWGKNFFDQIMLLNDPREVFSMALMALGYSANDSDPTHIKAAYEYLQQLLPNIKLFNSDAIPSAFIDGDVRIGMAWNGDIYRGQQANSDLVFIFPQDGFVIWTDCLAIPKYAPHPQNALKLINFLLKPDIANQVTSMYGFGTTNLAGKKLLPTQLQNNPIIFPDKKTLSRGQFQTDVSTAALKLYSKYWERLKIGG